MKELGGRKGRELGREPLMVFIILSLLGAKIHLAVCVSIIRPSVQGVLVMEDVTYLLLRTW